MKSEPVRRRDFLRHAAGAGAAVAATRGLLQASEPVAGPGERLSATQYLDDLFAGFQPYWGDLHAHTGYSDGFGTPAALYDYARVRRHLDFCAITDHAEWMIDYQDRLSMADGSPIPLWSNLVSEAEASNVPGAFVTFAGFEWTRGDTGHRNVIFGTADVPDVPPSPFSHPTPSDLWAALAPYVAMTIPHHPTRWGPLMDWSHYNPAMDRLVEIYSKWGNGASAWASYEPPKTYQLSPHLRPQAAASGVDAMYELGHRLGIIAGSDSHQGHAGSTAVDRRLGTILPSEQYPTTGEGFFEALDEGYTFDHREPTGGGGGLAGVWASALTRAAVWDGLYARRTLGTTGIRPTVRFAVGDGAVPSSGAIMGSELTVVGEPSLYASAVPEPGSAVTKIILLKTNDPLLTVHDPEPGVAVTVQDHDLPVGATACYRALVHIHQKWRANRDGDTLLKYNPATRQFFRSLTPQLHEQVWTSPVWVTRVAT